MLLYCRVNEKKKPDYYISLINNGESNSDDSDPYPNFVSLEENIPFMAIPLFSSLFSTSSSVSSSSSSSDSSSLSKNEDVDLASPSNWSTLYSRKYWVECRANRWKEKEENKGIWEPNTWKTTVAKLLRNSGKVYQFLSKTKNQVPERKLRLPLRSQISDQLYK